MPLWSGGKGALHCEMDFLVYHKADEKGHLLEATLRAFVQTRPSIRLTSSVPLVITPTLLPCLLVKVDSTVVLQLMKPFDMFGGEKMTPECVAYVLGKYGVVPEEVREDPRGYPYNADEFLNFPMTLTVPDPAESQATEERKEPEEEGSLGERIQAVVQRVFDHPIAQQMRG